MFLALSPAPELAALVQAYWFVEDLPGDHAGHLIRTSPVPLAVLSVNMGRPNAAEDGALVPAVSLLGLQSHARAWRSCPDTCFVMVMLSIPGLVRLFPHAGPDSADRLVDLAAMTGDACAQSLEGSVGAEQDPRMFSPGIFWSGFCLNLSGSVFQILHMNSYGVRPLSVFSLRTRL